MEWPFLGGDPAEHAESLARAKAASVPGELVVGADTIVVAGGQVLGKPSGPDAATAMLAALSGRTHEVITAIAVNHLGALRWAHDRARVTFRRLAAAEIAAYVATGEPLDKAGAYAWQGGAREFVTELEGDPETVVGLPIALLRRLLPPGYRGG